MKSLLIQLTLFTLLFTTLATSAQVKTDSLQTKQLHIISYQRVISNNYKSWAIQYREFKAESKEFVIPLTYSFGNSVINGSYLKKKNIKEVDTFSLGVGFDGYEYLGDGLYFNLGVGVQSGMESIERNSGTTDKRFLIGASGNTGFLYVPFPDFGFTIGAKVIGKLSNSKALTSSVGFSLELGLNF